jgi:hypothetical protein
VAVIDMEALVQDVDVVHASEEEIRAAIDEEARAIFGISGDEYIERLRSGTAPEDPAALGLDVLARALIER